MDEKLQSIMRDSGSASGREEIESNLVDTLNAKIDELNILEGNLKTVMATFAGDSAHDAVFHDTVTADRAPEEAPVAGAVPEESFESDAAPSTADAPVEESLDDSDEKKKKRTNRWIRELRLLKGLGKKSAATLVDAGVNSIRELSDLPAGQREVLRDDGLRDIDEWVKAARKVRFLNDSLGLSLKDAVEFVKTNTWPERFLHMPDSELSELSTEFPEILDWVRDSRSAEAGEE